MLCACHSNFWEAEAKGLQVRDQTKLNRESLSQRAEEAQAGKGFPTARTGGNVSSAADCFKSELGNLVTPLLTHGSQWLFLPFCLSVRHGPYPPSSEPVLWCALSPNMLENTWVPYNHAFGPCLRRGVSLLPVSSQDKDLLRASVVRGSGRVNMLLYQAWHGIGLQAELPAGHCRMMDVMVPREGRLSFNMWSQEARQALSCQSLPCLLSLAHCAFCPKWLF